MLCIVTFSFAWIGSTRLPNNKYQYLLNLAGCIHVSIFLLYIVLSYYVALELPSDVGGIDFERQLIGKIGIYISALAGLGLIRKPWSFLPLLEKGESDIDDELLSNDMSINDDSSALEAAAEEILKEMKRIDLIKKILLVIFLGSIWYYFLMIF